MDLIDRTKLIEALGASCSTGGKCEGCKYESECDDLRIINNQPWVRAVVPPTGEWTEYDDESRSPFLRHRYLCSACGESNVSGRFDYCPNCGAIMRNGYSNSGVPVSHNKYQGFIDWLINFTNSEMCDIDDAEIIQQNLKKYDFYHLWEGKK